MQSPVTVLIALPYPNLSSEQTKTLFALHCAMKDGHYFFDELGLGSYVDKHNVAIVAPCLGNSFFVDNKFQSAGAFLRNELMPYLKKNLISLLCQKKIFVLVFLWEPMEQQIGLYLKTVSQRPF